MIIHGLNKLTLLDYPEKIACTVFVGACPFRCPFCHNGSLVLAPNEEPEISEREFLDFLDRRKGKLQGVCVSGGEPTAQPGLDRFIRKVKEKGYLIKLDTNGYFPKVLEDLLNEGLLDYIAMDIKSSENQYDLASGISTDMSRIRRSLKIVRSSEIPYEFRTTVVKGIHTKNILLDEANWLKGCRHWYLQQYVESDLVIHKDACEAFSQKEMEDLLSAVKRIVPTAELRGI